MYRVPAFSLAIICCLFSSDLFSQSSSQWIGGASKAIALPSRSGSIGDSSSTGSVSNSMPTQWRRWESILNQTFSDRLNGRRHTADVIRELRQLGLPVVLDPSALDDSIEVDEIIELKLPHQSLGARLRQWLSEKNACLVFRDERILIISLDDADDMKYFMTITYDVSEMGVNPRALVDLIQNSVQTDDWMNTGQGLGTIEYLSVRGRDLLIVSQSYGIQSELRQLLNGMDRLTSNRNLRNRPNTNIRVGHSPLPPGMSSQPVIVPQSKRFSRSNNVSSGGIF